MSPIGRPHWRVSTRRSLAAVAVASVLTLVAILTLIIKSKLETLVPSAGHAPAGHTPDAATGSKP